MQKLGESNNLDPKKRKRRNKKKKAVVVTSDNEDDSGDEDIFFFTAEANDKNISNQSKLAQDAYESNHLSIKIILFTSIFN
jgi:hypothetical protein